MCPYLSLKKKGLVFRRAPDIAYGGHFLRRNGRGSVNGVTGEFPSPEEGGGLPEKEGEGRPPAGGKGGTGNFSPPMVSRAAELTDAMSRYSRLHTFSADSCEPFGGTGKERDVTIVPFGTANSLYPR